MEKIAKNISTNWECFYIPTSAASLSSVMGNNINAWLRGSALYARKPARGTSHVFITKMAARPIPIKESCSTASEYMLSPRVFV